MVSAIVISVATVYGLALVLTLWVLWRDRRQFRRYRRWVGGRWALQSPKVDVWTWKPEAEVREGEHVVAWEVHERTRVRMERP